MSTRVRRRHQRMKHYYHVIRPNGTITVISARQFNAGVADGDLIPDTSDNRLARVRKSLRLRVDGTTGRLIFQSRRAPAITRPRAGQHPSAEDTTGLQPVEAQFQPNSARPLQDTTGLQPVEAQFQPNSARPLRDTTGLQPVEVQFQPSSVRPLPIQ